MDRRLDGRYVGNDFKAKRVTSGLSYEDGNFVTKVAKATFDTAGNDSGAVSNKTIAAHGLGVFIPKNAMVKRTWFEVLTGFTSATNAGTIALSVATANDVKAATAVSNAMYSGAGLTDGVQDGTSAHIIETTAEKEITATVAVEALTAGKLRVFVEYIDPVK